MTRINIIPVSELADQHLIAEYREITMVPAALKRTLNSKIGLRYEKISKEYTVGFSFVLLCVRMGIIPNLFGFSLNMERRGTHYWQEREAPNMVGHDQLQEQQLLRELEKSNKIKVF